MRERRFKRGNWLGLREGWGDDTLIFHCGCHMLIWPWKDGKRAIRLDCCGKHFDSLAEELTAGPDLVKYRPDILAIIRYEHENLADVQERE